jgi:Protein of unknown function (DUF3606)
MTDHRQRFHPLDEGRINVADPLELEYWCRQLGCSEAALRDAVAGVGTHVTAVRDRLSGHAGSQ